MKKKLPAHDIANELSGSSVFFSTQKKPALNQSVPAQTEADAATGSETNLATSGVEPQQAENAPASTHDTMTPRTHETKRSRKQPQMAARPRTTTTPAATPTAVSPDLLEEIRRVVKQLGKEAATHRFTVEEKRALADLVYTYHRQGYRTSENEITRIAVNWLLLDFKGRGEQSVLSRMLELLHG